MNMAGHVRDSVKQIDNHSWLIGDKLVLQRQQSAREWLWRDTNDGGYYNLAEAPPSPPPAIALPADSHVRLVHDAGDASAVWSFGDAFLKVKLTQDRTAATREHVTLRWLAEREISFAVPTVLYQAEESDRSYLFVSRVPGKTLGEAWRDMGEREKQHYVCRIAEICEELSAWRSTSGLMTGVDGAQFPESWLDVCHNPHDFRPETLRKNCDQLGMDCSTLVFCHSDLGPYNIMIDSGKGSVGIIDWEMAGFAPREWIRTKFGVSWAMDFEWNDVDADDSSLTEWRKRVEEQLGKNGFPEVAEAWKQWCRIRLASGQAREA